MNEKTRLQQLLSEYQPTPGKRFAEKMETAPWVNSKEKMNLPSTHRLQLGWKFAIAVVLILAALSFAIPGVRASISAWLGLTLAPSNQMPVTSVTLVALTTPTTQPTPLSPTPTQTALQPTPSKAVPTELSLVAPQVSWTILTPLKLPAGYRFDSAYLDTNNQMVDLTYTVTRSLPGATDPSLTTTKSITLLQALTNDFVPMEVSPDATLVDVQVNGQPAVYVIGAWDTSFVADATDPNGGKMVSTWRNDLTIQNLFWQVGKVYVTLITDDDTLTRQDLIDMANSIGQ